MVITVNMQELIWREKIWAGIEGFLAFYRSLAWIGHERLFKPVYAS